MLLNIVHWPKLWLSHLLTQSPSFTVFTSLNHSFPAHSAKLCPIYNTLYCHGVLSLIDFLNYKKELFELLHVVSIIPILNHYQKLLIQIEHIMKTIALNYITDTNEMNFQKYFDSMFTESNDNHSHDTRHKSLLYKLPTKTSTKWLCIYYYYYHNYH